MDAQRFFGVNVQLARKHVRYAVAPENIFFKGQNLRTDGFQNGHQVEFGILQKAHQQLQRTVAGAASQTIERAIHVIGILDNRLNGIGIGQLLLIVTVNTNFGFLYVLFEFLQVVVHIFAVQRPETVHNVHSENAGFLFNLLQRLFQFPFDGMRNRHDIDRGSVPLLVSTVGQVNGFIHIPHIGGNPDHIHRAVFFGTQILSKRFMGILHYGDFALVIHALNHLPDIVIFGEPPDAELFRIEHLLTVPIAQLHHIHAGLRQQAEYVFHHFKRKMRVVHQSAIANRAIDNFQLRSVHVMLLEIAFRLFCCCMSCQYQIPHDLSVIIRKQKLQCSNPRKNRATFKSSTAGKCQRKPLSGNAIDALNAGQARFTRFAKGNHFNQQAKD